MLMLLFLCSAASISSLRAVVGVLAFPLPGWFSGESLPWLNKRLWMWLNRKKCDVTLLWTKNFWIWKMFLNRDSVSTFFSCFSFCNIYLQGKGLLTFRNFSTTATWRNGFSPLFVPFGYSLFLSQQYYFQKSLNTTICQQRLECGKRKRFPIPSTRPNIFAQSCNPMDIFGIPVGYSSGILEFLLTLL